MLEWVFFWLEFQEELMSNDQLKIFRLWLATLPEQNLNIENMLIRIDIALNFITRSNK